MAEVFQVVDVVELAKDGGDVSEDAFAVDPMAGRLAVADGAASAPRSGEWAAHLVERWVVDADDNFEAWLERAVATFGGTDVAEDADWFVVESAERSAFATFLGATLVGRCLRLVAVGDTCGFVLRGSHLLLAHPLDDVAQFGSTPDLVEASSDAVARAVRTAQWAELEVAPGDEVVVASDALAAALVQTGDPTWEQLGSLDVAALRSSGRLADDDVTLVRVTVPLKEIVS